MSEFITVETPNGPVRFPAGMSREDMAAALNKLPGAAPAQPRTFKQALYDNVIGDPSDGVKSYGEALGTWLSRAGESMTLGVVGDEASAKASSMVTGREYDDELQRFRENEKDMSGLGRFSADIAGAALPAFFGAGVVSQGANLTGKAIRGMLLGGGAGFTQGFAEGEGNAVNRLNDGFVGAGIGAGLGLMIPGVAELAKQGRRAWQTSAARSKIGKGLGDAFGVSPETGRIVARMVGDSNPDDMLDALNRAGDSAMLADAAPGATSVLDAAMRSPTPGASVARQRVDARAAGAYDNVMDALNGRMQGPQMPPVAAQRTMRAAARPTINPLYQAAYETPINYASDAGRKIEDLVRRLPSDKAMQAIKKAQELMVYDGLPRQQIMASIADDGSVKFTQMPNTMQLDYIKRAFDEMAEAGKDAVTGIMNPDGRFASRIARDLRDAVKEAVPVYGEALDAAATDIRQRGAIRTGQALLQPNTTVEDAAEAIADATGAELRAMRAGVRGQIDHIMGNVRAVASDQNIDARQAMKLYGDLSSPNARAKLQALFGDEWPDVQRALDEASSALGLRARVATNSATQPRQVADQMIADEVAPGALRSLKPLDSARVMGQRALGSDPESIARLSDEVKAELADLLTRPNQAQDAVRETLRQMLLNQLPANAGRATQFGATAAGLSALPSTTETIRKQLGLQSVR